MDPPRPMIRTFGSAGTLLVGAVTYAAIEGPGGADFDLTPLLLGLIAIAAGLAGVRARPVATGLVLAGWGTAVLLVDHGVVPGARTTPAYMLGIAAGLLAAAALAPEQARGAWLTSASIVAFTAPLGMYLAYDAEAVARWPLWAAVLVAWAGWELFWSLRTPDPVFWSLPDPDPGPAPT